MHRTLFLVIAILLGGCTTNQIHFAPYSTAADIHTIKSTKTNIDITKVSGVSTCTKCKESDKIVWHAANNGGNLYEGFSKIPINDWKKFTKTAIESTTNSNVKVEIEIHRIFLKTWQNPSYYACQSEIYIHIDGHKYSGKSMVKIKGSGQDLLHIDRVRLNPLAIEAVQLSLKAAYINALQQMN
ncbi:MAG: hypothetical protein ACN6O6_19195 [Pseudomonas sp.]|uniref:hypothetical protein n=1 Tax=Pseudomonas sp. TaxID=306 RepID=UPI003D0ED7B1